MLAFICLLACAAQLYAFTVDPAAFDQSNPLPIAIDFNALTNGQSRSVEVFEDSTAVEGSKSNSVQHLLNVLAEPYCGLVDEQFGEERKLVLNQAIANQPEIVKNYVNFKFGDKVQNIVRKDQVKKIINQYCLDRVSEMGVFDQQSGDLQTQLLDIKYMTQSGEVQSLNASSSVMVLEDGSIGIPFVDIEAGPIWSNDHAQEVCPRVCEENAMVWHGQWTTTIANEMSVCFCDSPDSESFADNVVDIVAGQVDNDEEVPTLCPSVCLASGMEWINQWKRNDKGQVLCSCTSIPEEGIATRADVSEGECQRVFCDAMVKQHNVHRAKHGVKALQMDKGESKSAQAWSKVLARENRLRHGRSGENLAMFGGKKASIKACSEMGKVMTDMWYNEVKKYNFNNPGFSMETGHFTQVVWKGSSRLGCGVSISGGNTFWGVGHYAPGGNVIGQFPQNVPRPRRT